MVWTARLLGEDEKERFNAFTAGGPKGHILQSWEWGDVKAGTGWIPLRLVVEEEGEVVAAISLLERKIPLINKKIFYAPRGPVLDYSNRQLFDFLLEEVRKVARQRGAFVLKIDPDISSSDKSLDAYLREKGFVPKANQDFEGIQPRYVFRLDITPSIEELTAALHSKTRYNIRLAKRKGVTVKEDCTREDLKAFYEILTVTAERDNFLVRAFSYFEILWECLVEHGLAKLFMAEYEGRYIAGTLAFIFGDKAWYLYGASSNKHRNVMPNYLLQWAMISWAKSKGCTMYDFRGVPGNLTEDNPLYGLYRFKKGFGAEYTEFVGEYDLVYSPFYYRVYNNMEKVYSGGFKKIIRAVRKAEN